MHRGEAEEQPGEQQGEEQEKSDSPLIEIKDLTTRELFSIAINDPDLQPIGEPATFHVFCIIQDNRCPPLWENDCQYEKLEFQCYQC